MVKRLFVGAIAGLALASLGAHLNAYVFSGHRWPGNSVPFYVNPVNQDVSQSAAITAVQVAASNWKNQSTADIYIYYAGTTTGSTIANNGRNEVFFRNESNGSTGAVTYWWYGGNGKLMDADMMFYDAGFKFFTGQSGCSLGIYIEDLATHEFGHFLGINHSADTTATMYPTMSAWCNQSWRYLSQDDITAVQFAYPATSESSTPPAAPANATAVFGATVPQVMVSWADNSTNETGFRVERSTDGVNFTIVGQPAAGVTSFLDQSTVFSRIYQYRVRAVNANGASVASNVALIQTPAKPSGVTKPAAPTAFLPTPGATGVTSTTTNGYYIRWYAAAEATSYDVYFGTSSNPPKIATVTPPAGMSQWKVGTFYQGAKWSSKKTYYWRVVAKNASGATAGSIWKFTTK
jgi:Matrixin